LENANFASAGATAVAAEILVLKDQRLFLGDSPIPMPRMEVDRNGYGVYGKVNFGNIGQDAIGQFKKVVLSFDYNYLKLYN
jgi:hypothetical protein